MSTDTTVSLDNFYLFNEPHSYAGNSHYIGSETIKILGSFLIGANKLYQYKATSLWILKGVLKDNVLLLDNSFDDPDFVNEQLTILEFVGTPTKVQYECLWTYFNLPSVEEINKLSLQVTQRKVDEFTTPEKVYYYKCIDREIFNGTYDEWIVEMDVLFEKWKDCERVRLAERGHTTSQIEYHLEDKTISAFRRQYANDQITFYVSQKTSEQTDLSKHDYSFSVAEMGLSTGLNERYLLTNIALPLSEYIDLMLRMTHTILDTTGVIHHATVIHNYHRSTQPILTDVDHPF